MMSTILMQTYPTVYKRNEAKNMTSIQTELFSFAYIPSWYEQLYELAQFAMPEPWRFRSPEFKSQNDETPILERYIQQIFRKQAIDYNYAPDQIKQDAIFYIRNNIACFNTGLLTSKLRNIYMVFEKNKRMDAMRQWYFKAFVDESSPMLKYVSPLPDRPAYPIKQWNTYFDPDWEIRVNVDHILNDAENVARLPESIQDAWNLPLLLETAVEMARRRARIDWSLAVPQAFQSRLQFLLPMYLTRMDKPDLAMALSVMDGYYIGHTCLTLEMAYQNARLLARPTARWLADLVEPDQSLYA